jgi:hypothetical protein
MSKTVPDTLYLKNRQFKNALHLDNSYRLRRQSRLFDSKKTNVIKNIYFELEMITDGTDKSLIGMEIFVCCKGQVRH